MDKHIEVKSTPAANWRQEGKTDPHNTRYECQRVDLTMGQLTDDEIANAVFLCDHRTSFDSIVYLTAAKDRIRWLSRSNEALIAQLEAAQKETGVYLAISEDVGAIVTLLQGNEWAEHVAKTNVGGALEQEITQLINSITDLRERAEAAEAALSAANEKLKVPAGYCIMPESLTAENGAKGALSGEFFTETDITCEHCNDLGVQTVRTAIGWSTIKDIYKMAVSATAIHQAGFTVEEDAPIVITPAPAGVMMRPQSENPLERCAAGRDGECHHKDCPQLRDNEPMATGRHCPIDNWDDE
ncbi:hypothetical protein AXW37_12425 [Yersinia ruckeri]|nr:hypothetical protein QMA0440_02543 [Yersinia ruckeri]OJC57080.1 hypothetical protein AXW37_12425 [Yersinia ruckeri]OJC85456.1 hypothetical protein AXW45_12620 [Yersinia ruckeri]